MRVAGLFVGVDLQEDPSFLALTFAGRDALVFGAVYGDLNETVGGAETDAVVLVGLEATLERVLIELDALVHRTQSASYELVHVHFSCHGTYDGRLVLAGTRRDDLANTALAAHEITMKVRELRGTHVVITFDCCFAETVRGMAESPAAMAFAEAMWPLAEGTRSVCWGCQVGEASFESPKFGHGFFSYGLISGLRPEVASDDGHVRLEAWLREAMDFAHKEAELCSRRQTPGGYVHLQTGARIATPPRGPRQERLRQASDIHPISDDPQSLAVYDFSPSMIGAIAQRIDGCPLNQLQCDAVSIGGTLADRNVVAWAPTSAGKTLVGELAVLRAWRQRRRAVVLLPTRSLVHEQYEQFLEAYGALGIDVVRSCGDLNDDDDRLSRGNYQVAFATYEKFAALSFVRDAMWDGVGVLVLDEVQLIADNERGRTVEMLLARARLRRLTHHQSIQIIALCAPVDDLANLDHWLSAELVRERERPLPLHQRVLWPPGFYREQRGDSPGLPSATTAIDLAMSLGPQWQKPEDIRRRLIVALVRQLVADDERVLIFAATRTQTISIALALTNAAILPACAAVVDKLDASSPAFEETRASVQLRQALVGGLGFHSRDLRHHERAIVERAFRDGSIRVLVATSGLATGVNTPASSVILADTSQWVSEAKAMVPRALDVTAYRNMAGRAGRLRVTNRKHGTSFLIADNSGDADDLWAKYIVGVGDTLRSGLSAVLPADLAISLLALTDNIGEADLGKTLQQQTFDGFLHPDDDEWAGRLREQLRSAVDGLVSGGFVERTPDAKLRLTARGRVCASSGIRIESAERVLCAFDNYLNSGEAIDVHAMLALTHVTIELDQTYIPIWPEKNRELLAYAPERFKNRPALNRLLATGCDDQADEDVQLRYALRLRRFFALWLWIEGRSWNSIEQLIHFRDPATQPFFNASKRTSDMMRPVAALVAPSLAARGIDGSALSRSVHVARVRLEHGIRKEALPLASLDLSRSEIHELLSAGFGSAAALLDALDRDDPALRSIVSAEGLGRLRSELARRQPERETREHELRELFEGMTL